MRSLILWIVAVSAFLPYAEPRAPAQVFRLTGGASSGFQAQGAGLEVRGKDYEAWSGAGVSEGHLIFGAFNAHHYRYSTSMSTFLVECDLATWQRYGFADKTIEESKETCERVFASALDGHRLVSNKSVWRNFPWIWIERFRHSHRMNGC